MLPAPLDTAKEFIIGPDLVRQTGSTETKPKHFIPWTTNCKAQEPGEIMFLITRTFSIGKLNFMLSFK